MSRFRNIVDYLRQYSEGAWYLDQNLDEVQQADSVAYVTPTRHNLRDLTIADSPPSSNPVANASSTSTFTSQAKTTTQTHLLPTALFSNGQTNGSSPQSFTPLRSREQSTWDSPL